MNISIPQFPLASEGLIVSAVVAVVGVVASVLVAVLLKPRPKNIPTNAVNRGEYLDTVIGRRKVGCFIGWVGDRSSKNHGVLSSGASWFVGGATHYYEGALHFICPGPGAKIHRIWSNEQLIWWGTIDAATVASGTQFSCPNEDSQFLVYWGKSTDPVDAYSSGQIGINSTYPNILRIVWNKKFLGGAPLWPVMQYDIEVHPDDIAAAANLDLTVLGTPTWYDESTPLTDSGAGTPTVWINGQQSIPSGSYTITYYEGAFMFAPGSQWVVHPSGPAAPTLTLVNSSGGFVVQCPGNTTGYSTQQAAQAANYGAQNSFTWGGGILGVQYSDRNYTDNVAGNPNPTFSIQKTDGSVQFKVSCVVTPGGVASNDMGANHAAAFLILTCAQYPWGCGLAVSNVDLVSLALAATAVAGEGLRCNILVEGGKEANDQIEAIRTDMGMVTPQVGGLLTPYIIRPETPIGDFDADILVGATPEQEQQVGNFQFDRFNFLMDDAQQDFAQMDVPLVDDANASNRRRPQTVSLSIPTIVSRGIAWLVANRRRIELAANVTKLPPFKATRTTRNPMFHPGRAFTMSGQQYRIASQEIDDKGIEATFEAVLDQYGDPTIVVTPPDANYQFNGPPPGTALPDIFFQPLMIPKVLWPSQTTPCFGVGRVRANSNIATASIWASTTSGGTYSVVGEQDAASAGGVLTTAFNSTGGFLANGPHFTSYNSDILDVPDLTGDATSYNSGALLCVCENEIMLLTCVLAHTDGTYSFRYHAMRGAYGTTVATHAIGTPAVIIVRAYMSPITGNGRLALNQGTTIYIKTQPSTQNATVDLSAVTPEPLFIPYNLLATILIISPTGSQTYYIGAVLIIQWKTAQLTGTLNIDVSYDGGTTWASIVAGISDTGSYSWNTTGATASTTTDIRVSSALNTEVYDISYPFTLATPIGAPGSPSASIPADYEVSLTWSAVAGATGYDINRSTVSGGPYTLIATSASASYLDTDAALLPNVKYYYVINAYNATATSPNSSEVNGVVTGLCRLFLCTETSGTVVHDTSRYAVNVNLSGSTSWSSGLVLSGGSGTSSDTGLPLGMGPWTISVTYHTTVSGSGQQYALAWGTGALGCAEAYTDKGTGKAGFTQNGGGFASTTTVNTGTTFRTTITFDGTNYILYTNSTSETTSNTTATPINIASNGSFFIGSDHAGSELFVGTIVEIRIYNRKISSTEVAALP